MYTNNIILNDSIVTHKWGTMNQFVLVLSQFDVLQTIQASLK